ncbi:helix-turn-helix transcriptional regulator [Pedobacter agri]|uniref:Helix-turn-helix domain-containing protein n=1 Tax=Pedobacter agri TaxID=454586 RepID=A0A9X3DDI5_9SPHI|nr:helix-turn-helix domain-containing protein [Pedobacter agri]MCX3265637.1 helix-turn-helix domain-containing protein [Pedobacter agri]
MKKIDTLIELLYKIYLIIRNLHLSFPSSNNAVENLMTRQQVKDFLGISESTYKRKVKDGTLRPIKMPGGDRYFRNELLTEFEESKRRGRI